MKVATRILMAMVAVLLFGGMALASEYTVDYPCYSYKSGGGLKFCLKEDGKDSKFRVRMADGSKFAISSTMKIRVGSPETYGVVKASASYSRGSSYVDIPLDLTYFRNETKTFYATTANSERKAGPITVTHRANSAPTAPSFRSLPSSAMKGESVNIGLRRGTDPDGDKVKIHLTAENSNRTDSSPWKSSFSSGGNTTTGDVTFYRSGTQRIWITSFDESGAASSTVERTITVKNPNSAPSSPSFSSLPSSAMKDVGVNIGLRRGTDPDGDKVKIHLTAENSNRTNSSPWKSSFSSGGSSSTANVTFYRSGTQRIWITSFDESGAVSSTVERTIMIEESSVYNVSPTSGTYEKGQQLQVRWSTKGISSSTRMKVSIKRDSFNGQNEDYYDLTKGGSTPNVGSAFLDIPTGINDASDWRVYVGVKDNQNLYGAAQGVITIVKRPEPPICKFTVDFTNVDVDQPNVLHWEVLNSPDTVEITSIGNVAAKGMQPIPLTETKTFKITAKNSAGKCEKSVTVTVTPTKPTASITASKTDLGCGEKTKLIWDAQNADSVEVTGLGIVPAKGEREVSPQETTVFEITAKRGNQTATDSVTINNNCVPADLSLLQTFVDFTANAEEEKTLTLRNNGSELLHWVTTNLPEWLSLDITKGNTPAGESLLLVLKASKNKSTETRSYTLTFANIDDPADFADLVITQVGQMPDVVISGYVRDKNTAGVKGVSVIAGNEGGADVTDKDGFYEITVPYDWTGNVAPIGSPDDFKPSSHSFENLIVNKNGQDFLKVGNQDIIALQKNETREDVYIADNAEHLYSIEIDANVSALTVKAETTGDCSVTLFLRKSVEPKDKDDEYHAKSFSSDNRTRIRVDSKESDGIQLDDKKNKVIVANTDHRIGKGTYYLMVLTSGNGGAYDLTVESLEFITPVVEGNWSITRSYETGKTHLSTVWPKETQQYALDFARSCTETYGQPIVAIESGRVLGPFYDDEKGYGRNLGIDHANGYASFYCHNAIKSARPDVAVQKGQEISALGDTGNVDGSCSSHAGAHLHFFVVKSDHLNENDSIIPTNTDVKGIKPEPMATVTDFANISSIAGSAKNNPATFIIIDDTEADFSGTAETHREGYLDGMHYANGVESKLDATIATYTPDIPVTMEYDLYVQTPKNHATSKKTKVRVEYSDGDKTFYLNQLALKNQWAYIGTFLFEEGSTGKVEISNEGVAADQMVGYDAVMFTDPQWGPVRTGGATGGNDSNAILTASSTTGQASLEVTFEAKLTEGKAKKITIDFGDGTPKEEHEDGNLMLLLGDTQFGIFTHEFEQAGSYTVTATIEDKNGTLVDSEPVVITVTEEEIPLEITNLTVEETSSHTFEIKAFGRGDIEKYHFDFGDGENQESNTGSVSHTYPAMPEIYTITCVLEGKDGAMSDPKSTIVIVKGGNEHKDLNVTLVSNQKVVLVNERVNLAYQITGNASECYLDYGDGYSENWNITFEDILSGTANSGTKVHAFTAAGTYTLQITVNDSEGNQAIAYAVVQVVDPSSSTFVATPLAGKAPLKVSFSGRGDVFGNGIVPLYFGELNYELDPGDGSSIIILRGQTLHAQRTYQEKGEYNASLKVYTSSRKLIFSASEKITVAEKNQEPVANITSGVSQVSLYETVEFAITASDEDGEVVKTIVDFGDGNTEELTIGTTVTNHQYATPGSYQIVLTVTDNDGATSVSAPVEVTVIDPILPTLAISTNNSGAFADFSVEIADCGSYCGSVVDVLIAAPVGSNLFCYLADTGWNAGKQSFSAISEKIVYHVIPLEWQFPYAYLEVTPLMAKIDVNQDGEWDVETTKVVPKKSPKIEGFEVVPNPAKVGKTTTVNIKDLVDSNGDGFKGSIDYGDGTSETFEIRWQTGPIYTQGFTVGPENLSFAYTYNAVGDYTVKVNVTDLDGLTTSAEKNITVDDLLLPELKLVTKETAGKIQLFAEILSCGDYCSENTTIGIVAQVGDLWFYYSPQGGWQVGVEFFEEPLNQKSYELVPLAWQKSSKDLENIIIYLGIYKNGQWVLSE